MSGLEHKKGFKEFASILSSVFFATYSELPNLDPDDRLLADALETCGVSVRPAIWNDLDVDWSLADLCILRSTWDYPRSFEQFITWLDKTAAVVPIYNPPELVRWNADKSYLQDLAAAGIPVIPTIYITENATTGVRQPVDVRKAMDTFSTDCIVVKPLIGAGTYNVRRIDRSQIDAHQSFINELAGSHRIMLQKYMPSVEKYGERALVFIAGEYSHAVYKSPFQALLPAGEAGERLVQAAESEIDLARTVVNRFAPNALYARVDLIQDDGGSPCVIEFELIEPSLFLSMHPPAISRLADAIAGTLVRA